MDILSHVLKYHNYAQLLCTDAGVSIYWRNVLIHKYRYFYRIKERTASRWSEVELNFTWVKLHIDWFND